MKKPCSSFIARAVVAATAATLALSAFAQFGGGMGGMRRGGMGTERGMSRRESDERAPARPSLADSLYDLRMRLLITAGQAAAWERFHTAFMALDALPSRGVSASDEGRALVVLQQMLTTAQNRYARTEDVVESAKALYAVLTPDQQRTADDALPPLIREFSRPARSGPSPASPARE